MTAAHRSLASSPSGRRYASEREGDVRRPRLLVVSHVLPFPSISGQRQRVFNTLRAMRRFFHVTFLVPTTPRETESVVRCLRECCDDVVTVPAMRAESLWKRLMLRAKGVVHCALTGERWSNFVIGSVEFSERRVVSTVRDGEFDAVLFEYWHANAAAAALRMLAMPTVLDMHNVLWQARERQLAAVRFVPAWLRRGMVSRYRRREEAAWQRFDALIAINRNELAYVKERVQTGARVFYAPMGISLEEWPLRWAPTTPPRVAYYGGLGSAHNQAAALRCASEIMPLVWKRCPETELWIVGSSPPRTIRALESDRIRVTGFVENVAAVLSRMTCVLCPWEGTYGFRSRIVETMALGVPLVATPDAVDGMDLADGRGIRLVTSDREFADAVLALLGDAALAKDQSAAARHAIEAAYGFDETYERLAKELVQWMAHCRSDS